jgi:hypothetical protein
VLAMAFSPFVFIGFLGERKRMALIARRVGKKRLMVK